MASVDIYQMTTKDTNHKVAPVTIFDAVVNPQNKKTLDQEFEDMVGTVDESVAVDDADDTLVNTALRKTEQVLTLAEKQQARTNINAADADALATLSTTVSDNKAETDEKLSELGQKINPLNKKIPATWQEGVFYSNLGFLIGYNNNFKLSNTFAVKAGDTFRINTSGAGIPFLVKCDSDGNAISSLISSPSTASTTENTLYTHTIVEDCYVRVSYKYTSEGAYAEYENEIYSGIANNKDSLTKLGGIVSEVNRNLTELDSKITEVVGEVFDFEKWSNHDIQEGLYIVYNEGYLLSPVIRLLKGETIELFTSGEAPLVAIAACDSTGVLTEALLKYSGDLLSNKLYTYTAPSDIYVKVSIRIKIDGYSARKVGRLETVEDSIDDIQNIQKRTVSTDIVSKYIESGEIVIVQGGIDLIGYPLSRTDRIRFSKAVQTFDGYIAVPYGFIIHYVEYYSSWTDDLDFVHVKTEEIGERSCKIDSTYPLMRLVIRYPDNSAITPKDFYSHINMLSFNNSRRIDISNKSVQWNPGQFIDANTLTLKSSVRYSYSNPILVNAGDCFEINTCGADLAIISKCDSDGNITTVLLRSTSIATNTDNIVYKYVIEEDTYVILSYCHSNTDTYCCINGIAQINRNIKECLGSVESKDGEILSWERKNIQEYFTLVYNDNYRLSPAIFLRKGDSIQISTPGENPLWAIVRCDSTGEIINGLEQYSGDLDTNKEYSYTAVENLYVRVSIRISTDGYYLRIINQGQINMLKADIEEVKESITPKHLKILLLGNSYTSDAWGYVPFILKQYGITCEIYLYWRGALSLDDLVRFWESTDTYDETSPQASDGAYRYLYHIDTRLSEQWKTLSIKSAKELVAMGGWDVIQLQQWGRYSMDNSYTNPYFEQVVSLIRKSYNKPFVLAWQMAWIRVVDMTDLNKNKNLLVAETINKEHCADIVFPCATAIFNCQANSSLASIGDSTYHNFFSSDNVHLEEGLPIYAVGCTIAETLLKRFFPIASILGNTLRPTASDISSWNVPQQQMPISGEITSITDENCYLVQKAAIIANKYPYEIHEV